MLSSDLKKLFIRTLLVLVLMMTFSGSANAASITVTAPNGGEQWVIGTQHNITWTAANYGSCRVQLYYSTMGPSGTYNPIVTGTSAPYASTLKYSWTIPNAISTNAYVKAVFYGSYCGGANDISNNAFTIRGPDTTKPVITVVGMNPVTVEAGSSYTDAGATALDDVDGDITSSIVTVNPVNTAVIATYTVTYNVKDSSNNNADQKTRTVNVVDTTAPTIDAVTPIVTEATSSSGATVTITPPMSHDAVDGDLASSCDASTGIFPFGETTVTCSKTDAHGNVATPSVFTVTVHDTIAPSITAPTSVTEEATGVLTGVTLGTAAATDIADPSPTITNNAPVGGFPVGTTIVTWNATDASGNYATAAQSVTITDTTAPLITAPAAITAEATGFLTIVSLGTPVVSDIADPSPVVTNNAPVGGFPVGTTIVTWNATDSSGNYATATQSVTIVNFNAIRNGANRLVETQNNDGTWEWSNPDTNPATTSYPGINNILGVTAKGLVRAYLVTGNLSYLDAAKKTADLLVSKTPDGSGPDDAGTTGKHKVYGQDITFLVEFANAWAKAGNDGSVYSAKADEYMVFILNNPNRFCATGCANNASGLVQDNFNRRQPNLYGWDIEGWVEAAVKTGHTAFASEVVSNMSLHYDALSPTATGTYGTGTYYVLGLSGYLQSYILTGKTPAEYSAIKDQLLAELNTTDGSFKIYAGTDDGIKQTAAYALMALSLTTTDMAGTVNYLENSQSPGGIWIENDGIEYTEVESEILTSLVTFDETPPVITLLGSNPVSIYVGQTYTDAGAVALDNYDGVITSSIVTVNTVNTAIAGTYTVTYNVTDAHGNAATQVTRSVSVTIPPTVRYINGTVMDSGSHLPLTGVTVSTGIISSTTDGSGNYSLAVGSGNYPLTATFDIRYYTNNSVLVSTEWSAVVTQDIELVMKPTGNITGTVSG